MEFLTVTIKTLSPVVLTAMNNTTVMTESRDFISGTVLRGIIASRYISANKLGSKAHSEEKFRELFFEKLRFVDAYPVKDGKRSIVLPLSLQKAKTEAKGSESAESLSDILMEAPKAGYKPVKGFGIVTGKQIEKVSVNKQVKLHMSRSSEKERLSGRSLEGGIYNYEAIETGQTFQGLIIGAENDLQSLIQSLKLQNKEMICRIGRSKYTEYGQCSAEFGSIEPIPAAAVKGKDLYLRLETPWIPVTGSVGSAGSLINELTEKVKADLGTEDIQVGKIVAQAERIANFVGIWGLKRPEQQALAAGSVFALHKDSGWNDSDLEKITALLVQGQGCRTDEGFGQLRIWDVTGAVLGEKSESVPERKKIASAKVKELVSNILMRKILTLVKLQAERDVQQLDRNIADSNHSFARLESILGERNNLGQAKIRFRELLQNELREQSILDKRLQNLTLNGRELKEILTGKAPMPYSSLQFEKEVPVTLAEDVGFKIPTQEDGAVFYEYWLWFFRHGRKLAVARKGDQ